MKKKISAKILITQLVILCMTLFIFPMKVKADVSAYTFVYSARYTSQEVPDTLNTRYQLNAEINISANHEVSGRYIIWFYYSTTQTDDIAIARKNITAVGGQIDNVIIDSGVVSFNVLITGQKDVTVNIVGTSNTRTALWEVRSVNYSNTNEYGETVNDQTSMYYHVVKIEDTLTQIQQAVNSLSDVNEVDFDIYLPRSYAASTDGTNYANTDITTNVKDIYLKISPKNDDGHYIYKIDTGISSNNYLASINVVEVLGFTNSSYNPWNPKYYVDRSGRNIIIYIYDQILLGNNDTRYIVIHLNGGDYYLRYRNNQFNMWSMSDESIQYFQLLNYFKDIEYQNSMQNIVSSGITRIREALSTINNNIMQIISKINILITGDETSQESVDTNDDSNVEFKQQADQYDEIESTFQSTFTTDQEAVQQQFNNNTLTIFADTALWFTQQLNALYNASGQMKILFTMPLLLGLALFFIGRGAKTAAPNTIDSFYSSEMVDNTDGVRTYHVRRRSYAHRVYHGFRRGEK